MQRASVLGFTLVSAPLRSSLSPGAPFAAAFPRMFAPFGVFPSPIAALVSPQAFCLPVVTVRSEPGGEPRALLLTPWCGCCFYTTSTCAVAVMLTVHTLPFGGLPEKALSPSARAAARASSLPSGTTASCCLSQEDPLFPSECSEKAACSFRKCTKDRAVLLLAESYNSASRHLLVRRRLSHPRPTWQTRRSTARSQADALRADQTRSPGFGKRLSHPAELTGREPDHRSLVFAEVGVSIDQSGITVSLPVLSPPWYKTQ